MNTKNPIRKYINWYGQNLVDIAGEPAGKAIKHYCGFAGKVMLHGAVASALMCLAVTGYYKIRDYMDEKALKDLEEA